MSLLLIFGPNRTTQTAPISGLGTVAAGRVSGTAQTISGVGAVAALKSAGAASAALAQGAVAVDRAAGVTRSSSTTAALAAARVASKTALLSTTPTVTAWRNVLALITLAGAELAVLTNGVNKTKAIASASVWRLGRDLDRHLQSSTGSVVARLAAITKPSILLSASSAVTAWTPRIVAAIFSMAVSGSASLAQRLTRLRVIAPIDMVLRTVGRRRKLELPGMSTKIDGTFHAGETWLIRGTACDEYGNGLDLTGATVQLRITSGDTIVLDLATPSGGSIIDAPNGTYRFLISPAQQATMLLTSYDYEARVELSDLTVSVQNTGKIIVKPSKFVRFPPA